VRPSVIDIIPGADVKLLNADSLRRSEQMPVSCIDRAAPTRFPA
jgi:hypothetical protein